MDGEISEKFVVMRHSLRSTPQVFSHVLTGWEHPLIPMIVALVSSRSATSHPRNYLDRHIVIPAPSVRHMKLAGVNYLSCRAEKKRTAHYTIIVIISLSFWARGLGRCLVRP